MNTKEELEKLESEIEDILKPLEIKRRELRKLVDSEYIAKREKEFEPIRGKLFYSDKSTWSGYSESIYLVKVLDCTDWSPYNCCNSMVCHIKLDRFTGKAHTISIGTDRIRVDMFKTHYKELTPELFQQTQEFASSALNDMLMFFSL